MRRRGALGAPIGILLCLSLATQALGATWDVWVPVAVGDDEGGGHIGTPGGLVTLDATTAVAIYADNDGISVIRSTDSGMTWADPFQVSDFEDYPGDPHLGWMAIAGTGSSVDVAWIEDWHVKDDAHIRYARSQDGGAPYEPAKTVVSPLVGFPLDVAVAHGSGNVVALAWSKKYGGRHSIRVKVSLDGGANFGPGRLLARGGVVRDVKVAVGDGVIYVAYVARAADGKNRLRISRSVDAGSTWSDPVTISAHLALPSYEWRRFPGPLSITAAGHRAFVGYTALVNGIERARYRRTLDGGATWSTSLSLSNRRSGSPVLSLQDGVLRAAYTRCFNKSCGISAVIYRQKPPGMSWGEPEQLIQGDVSPWPAGVGFAGNTIVLWMLPPDGSGCCTFGTYAAVRSP